MYRFAWLRQQDSWKFPVDTKAFKEFRFDGKLLETRMMWKQSETNWIAATYIWDATQSSHSTRGLGEETRLILRLRADEFWSADGRAAPAEAVTSTDPYKATVNVDPTTASVATAFPGAKRITPGQHAQSLLWMLSHRRDQYQLPPLVSHVVDETDSQALADWIDSLH